jgi:tRNA splicing endonuclease
MLLVINIRRFCSCMVALLFSSALFSQTSVNTSFVADVLSEIYTKYDRMRYMSFDMRMVLQTDTVDGRSHRSEESGHFTIAGKSFYHAIGDVEYLQTDSFAISVYKSAKVMMVKKPEMKDSSVNDIMPGSKSVLASLMESLPDNYHMYADTTESGDSASLVFISTNELKTYRRIIINYDPNQHYLFSVTYEYDEGIEEESEDDEEELEPTIVVYENTLTIYYEHYHFDPDSYPGVFSPGKFIRFDGTRYSPSIPFAEYEFYDLLTPNISQTDTEAYILN